MRPSARLPHGIATNIFAERQKRLLKAGVIEREPLPSHQGRLAYQLTERGLSLGSVLKAVADWDDDPANPSAAMEGGMAHSKRSTQLRLGPRQHCWPRPAARLAPSSKIR